MIGIVTPRPHSFAKRALGARAKMIALRISANQEGEPHVFQQRQKPGPPKRRAFGTRRQIGAIDSAGIAKAHRRHRDLGAIIEGRAIHVEPLAQAIARGVIPRHAAFVHAPPGRLAGD